MRSLQIKGVTLGFGSGPARTMALDSIDLTLQGGMLTVVAGPSGSGKTSLLSVLGAILSPDSGSVVMEGVDVASLNGSSRARFRREIVGYVFQSFRLMTALTAEENIRLSLEIRRIDDRVRRAHDALDLVGLSSKRHLRPNEMSGGEKQRVAIARAIAHQPILLLADEPTASLDTANGLQVTKLLAELASDPDRIVVVVTHDPRLLPFGERIIQLQDGVVKEVDP